MHKIIAKIFLLFIISLQLTAQNYIPQNYFIPPVDITLYLSGTFAELRSDHFHSGMDIRTGEVEGLNIYAIADGYISRIKVTPGGYGKALYITHPNGFVSVYGHLQRYNPTLNEYVIKQQYLRESYQVDLFPKKDQFMVKQGEVVAISGNTGRSGGPHLHFEIRDEATQKPLNPLLFGFKVTDNTPPVINLVKIYPASINSTINHKSNPAEYFTVHKGHEYSLNNTDTITIGGSAYFGINTYDPFNNGNNKNGVYSIRLFVDSALVYKHTANKFSFDETRYINSFIDYKDFKQKKRRIQKSYIQPNNHLSIYNHEINKGVIEFIEDKVSHIRYVVSDIAGNETSLSFYVLGKNIENNQSIEKKPEAIQGELFTYTHKNYFKTDDLVFEVPGRALYDTIQFIYQVSASPENAYSSLHHLHVDYVPLHTWCNLSIWPDLLPINLQDKALIAKVIEDGEFESAGGEWVDGFIKTRIREFGNYCIVIDTVPPEIKPLNIKYQKNLTNQKTIKIKISDELSGIKTYNGMLNDNWILMEYDIKNELLIYRFDKNLEQGSNIFKLTVTDEKRNQSNYQAELIF
jgi:murein DD-endopeptidase MepM/ murein hydrolase activator NlpD